ncbi:MAG: hypothetical protein NNA19_01625 [Nitrospira sp.]|nr:hypothetical protein [Nitrospira sp.]MCP9473935.1 hypothetical protein [Nitrospira sp.]
MIDVTTDEGGAVMIGIGAAGVALFLIARVIGLVIQRKGEQGHPQPPVQALPSIRGEFAEQPGDKRKDGTRESDRRT